MQFVACKFRPEDERTYTYANKNGLTLAVGERVRVETRAGTGIAYIAELDVDAPKDVPEDQVRSVVEHAPSESASA